MKRILTCLLAILCAVASWTGCTVRGAENLMEGISPNPPLIGDGAEAENAAVCDFALRLFQNSASEGENTLISPLSVLLAVSMTANGAKEETLAQMEAVLGTDIGVLNGWAYRYLADLPKGEETKLSLANSIWFTDNETFTVNGDFLQTNADYYGAGVFKTPFDGSTLRDINGWVKDHTDGMVKEILDEIPEDAVMYLVNALAFDGEWQEIYKERQIVENCTFTTEAGAERRVDLMYSDEHLYLEDDDAVGFIKYYKDQTYAFAALLPKDGVTAAEYVASLTGEELYQILSEPQKTTVETAIPKFEAETSLEMSEILKNMGMPLAFESSAADFTGLGTSEKGNLFISRVLHKTTITVDERGTKAGAATVVEVMPESAMEAAEPKRVILDRPFVYMLIDCETNLPFFMGTVMDVGE